MRSGVAVLTMNALSTKLDRIAPFISPKLSESLQETTAQIKQEVRKETEATVALELKDLRAQLNEKTQKMRL